MSFGFNQAILMGRLGADAVISDLTNGGQVASFRLATDQSYRDRKTGERVPRTEWHTVVSFQDGVVKMLAKHATKGRLAHVCGELRTRKWRKDGETTDRYSTEIVIGPGGRVQFVEKPPSNGNGAAAEPANGSGDAGDDIPF